jgi:hypothetical protein
MLAGRVALFQKVTALVTACFALAVTESANVLARSGTSLRRSPEILQPDEANVAVAHVQMRSWVFTDGFRKILVFEEKDGKRTFRYVRTDELKEGPTEYQLAETVQPLRCVVLAAAFPYKRQVEEFRRKLRLPSAEAVLKEVGQLQERVGGDEFRPFDSMTLRRRGQPDRLVLPFDGADLERRTIDARSAPASAYQTVDLKASYQPLVVADGARFEPERRELEPLAIPGLRMPLLAIFGGFDRYPNVEGGLASVRDTLNSMKRTARTDESDGDPKPSEEIPDHCLIRVVDATVQREKIYQYRIRVRIMNPNRGRKDLPRPADAIAPVLLSDWYELRDRVVMPPELKVYVVNKSRLDESKTRNSTDSVILEAHRWAEKLTFGCVSKPVGAWVIAERLPVSPGEWIGRSKVDVPLWLTRESRYALAATSRSAAGVSRQETGIEVDFGAVRQGPLVVDFEGDKQMYLPRKGGPAAEDEVAVETLFVSSEGQPFARNSATDARDPERLARLYAYRQQIKSLRHGAEQISEPLQR